MTFATFTLRPAARFAALPVCEFTDPAATDPCAAHTAPAAAPSRRDVALSLHEQPQGYRLLAELPGVKRDALDIELENGVLSLRGRFPAWQANGNGAAAQHGPVFERKIRLPDDVDAAAIRAELADGILTLDLPRKAAAQPRKVPVV